MRCRVKGFCSARAVWPRQTARQASHLGIMSCVSAHAAVACQSIADGLSYSNARIRIGLLVELKRRTRGGARATRAVAAQPSSRCSRALACLLGEPRSPGGGARIDLLGPLNASGCTAAAGLHHHATMRLPQPRARRSAADIHLDPPRSRQSHPPGHPPPHHTPGPAVPVSSAPAHILFDTAIHCWPEQQLAVGA